MMVNNGEKPVKATKEKSSMIGVNFDFQGSRMKTKTHYRKKTFMLQGFVISQFS